ncbi:hypothetical protein [Acinetobacter pittii]|uniref:hypothetical protein n=1 Tax=Acinetobacter pittii TaxID=48296 RepID=UPI00254DD569|nr:hypothetical protein [Acinetobacter pittii]MEC6000785.1 hypothetical protein [Acinetobacter pittii]
MKKLYLFALIFILISPVQAKSVEKMTLEEKCGVFRDTSILYLDNYFNGQSREQQYGFIDQHTNDKESADLNKKLIDSIYDHIPLTMHSTERKSYKESYSSMIFEECMRSQSSSK